MTILLWIILGITVGLITSVLSGDSSLKSSLPTIYVGILGALVGGLFVRFVIANTRNVDVFSAVIAILGSILVLLSYKLVENR